MSETPAVIVPFPDYLSDDDAISMSRSVAVDALGESISARVIRGGSIVGIGAVPHTGFVRFEVAVA